MFASFSRQTQPDMSRVPSYRLMADGLPRAYGHSSIRLGETNWLPMRGGFWAGN